MVFELDISDMDRHEVELRLYLDKAKRRFEKAKKPDRYEIIVSNCLEKPDQIQENDSITVRSMGDEGCNRLCLFIYTLIDKCENNLELHKKLQDTLRRALLESVRRYEEPNGQQMCFFCSQKFNRILSETNSHVDADHMPMDLETELALAHNDGSAGSAGPPSSNDLEVPASQVTPPPDGDGDQRIVYIPINNNNHNNRNNNNSTIIEDVIEKIKAVKTSIKVQRVEEIIQQEQQHHQQQQYNNNNLFSSNQSHPSQASTEASLSPTPYEHHSQPVQVTFSKKNPDGQLRHQIVSQPPPIDRPQLSTSPPLVTSQPISSTVITLNQPQRQSQPIIQQAQAPAQQFQPAPIRASNGRSSIATSVMLDHEYANRNQQQQNNLPTGPNHSHYSTRRDSMRASSVIMTHDGPQTTSRQKKTQKKRNRNKTNAL